MARTMKADGTTVRQFGQAALPPSFLRGTKAKSSANETEQVRPSKKMVSLSDFLDRKLGKGKPAVTGGLVQEKECCFSSACSISSSPFSTKNAKCGTSHALDRSIFHRLNVTASGDGSTGSRDRREVGGMSPSGSMQCGHDSRKRKGSSVIPAGEDEEPATKRFLLVLGDDPKPRQKEKERRVRDNMEKPLFNHYENGAGWWDCDREGIDSEEVGCNEVWEGMSSTTVGGLEWH